MKFSNLTATLTLILIPVTAAAEVPSDLSMRPKGLPAAGRPEANITRRVPPRPGPISVKLAVDLPITALGFVASFLPQMIGGRAPSPSPLPLRAATVNGMDRGVTRNWSPAADTASDVLMGSAIVLPFAASLVDTWVSKPEEGYRAFFSDALVLAETYALTSAVTSVVKISVNRPRPYLYNGSLSEAERSGADGHRSFFSGHTATAFSMATSYSYLFTLRHRRSKLVIPIWVGTHALAAATAYLRVEAGKHFWSDVLVGAAVGSAIGLAVPYLHTRGNFFARLFFGGGDPEATRLTPSVSGDAVGVRVVGAF